MKWYRQILFIGVNEYFGEKLWLSNFNNFTIFLKIWAKYKCQTLPVIFYVFGAYPNAVAPNNSHKMMLFHIFKDCTWKKKYVAVYRNFKTVQVVKLREALSFFFFYQNFHGYILFSVIALHFFKQWNYILWLLWRGVWKKAPSDMWLTARFFKQIGRIWYEIKAHFM